jgi:hypothetical protein
MPDYSFRLRVDVAPGVALNAESNIVTLATTSDGHVIELRGMADQAVSKSNRISLRASGYSSEGEAEKAGQRLGVAFALSLVRHRIGVELWARRGGGMVFAAGLQMLEKQIGQRVLNDGAGLMVFETNPPPRFVSVNANAVRGASLDAFVKTFAELVEKEWTFSDRERISVDLFNASFFEPAADTRLITLVMSIEALLELPPRAPEAIALVGSFVDMVKASSLADAEKVSLTSAANWLRKESISASGRRLARERLGTKQYANLPAEKFFSRCYDIRSRLVHGSDSRVAMKEASNVVGDLEVFVSDLLVAPYIAVAA